MSSTLSEHLLFSLVESGSLGFLSWYILNCLPHHSPFQTALPSASFVLDGYCGQVSQNIKFFALILRKRRHAWGAPSTAYPHGAWPWHLSSRSLALASFPANAHAYQCHWPCCRQLNAKSKIPLWAQHCTNVADSKLGHCRAQSQPLVRRRRHRTLWAGSGPREFSGGGGTHSNIYRVRMVV